MSEKELLECLQKDTALGIETAIEQYGMAVKSICCPMQSSGEKRTVPECRCSPFTGSKRISPNRS